MDFSGKHVVVTGGTGALGSAVVGALLAAGATCIVPYVHEAEAQRFPHRGDPNVTLVAVSDLADEAQVAKVYSRRKALGLDPHRRRLCRGQGRRNRQDGADGADRQQSRLLLSVLPRRGQCHAGAAPAVASSMSRHDRRWNGAAAPA